MDQRALFEAAVVTRLKESGFLEIQIRVECLVRCDDGYQDEVVNAGWHYWNAALAAQAPAPSNGPTYLDFITPDEIFDKGPAAVKQWQVAKRAEIERATPQTRAATDE